MTVGQNLQLLWEQANSDFTVGQCCVGRFEQRMLDSYPNLYPGCAEQARPQ